MAKSSKKVKELGVKEVVKSSDDDSSLKPKIIPPVTIEVVINLVKGHNKALLRWAKMHYLGQTKTHKEWLKVLVKETVLSEGEEEAAIEKFKF